jgi:hypothetical protein
MSSINSNSQNNVPSYTLTYQYYPINIDMYDMTKFEFSEIKYCENKGGYVWYFSDMGKNKNNPVFNLWEPKIR